MGAASSKLIPAGMCAIRALAGIVRNSAGAPNLSPVVPKTRSPTANSLTAVPTPSTSPANSAPRIRGLARRMPETRRLKSEMARPLRRLASRVAVSNRLTVVAWTLTRTSSSAGTGRSTSSSRSSSGGPYLSYTTALISFGVQDLHDVGARRPAAWNPGSDHRHDDASQRYRNQLPGRKDVIEGERGNVAAEAAELVEEHPVQRDPCRYRHEPTHQREDAGRGGDHADPLPRTHAERLEGGGVAHALAGAQQHRVEDAGDRDQGDDPCDPEQDAGDHGKKRGVAGAV